MAIVSCYNVSFAYGEHWAVRNLDFHIAEASIFALVGPNGAGKSSTIKMLATLQEPSAGRILIDGYDAQLEPQAVRRRIGYLPDHFELYEDMSVERCLDFYAGCYGLGRGERRRRIGELLALMDLEVKRGALVRELSRGMKQRVGIARALLHDPPVLLLDEPANGLDPLARAKLRKVLLDLKAQGMTLLVSSHILTELSTFCDSVAIMQQGRMLEFGRLEEVLARLGGGRTRYTLSVLGAVEVAERVVRQLGGGEVEVQGSQLRFMHGAELAEAAGLVEALVRAGVRVTGLDRGQSDVEWAYSAVSSDQTQS
jgi:ABC-2 type transport system ATP-binding protein